MLSSLIFGLLGLIGLVIARSSSGNSVLVVLEPSLRREDFSIFFGDLEERGYNLSFRAPKDLTPAITQDGFPSFAHVILFVPTEKQFAPDISLKSLIDLLSGGTNLLIALAPAQSPINSLAAEFSLILPPPSTPLISHFPERKTKPNVIPINVPSHPVLSPDTSPVWFSGVPHAFGLNPFLVPILNAPTESFATDNTQDSDADALTDAAEKGGEGLWAGKSLGVVSGFQTGENTRVLWLGGYEMVTDEYMNMDLPNGSKPGNRQFLREVSAWAFQENLVLRIDDTSHHHVQEASPRDLYTTNDVLVFTTHISRWDPEESGWVPHSDLLDLQLEFTMLDPHIRTALLPVQASPGEYSVTFRAPDRHGVFKFVINHKRRGWTYLQSATIVSIAPPRHDGYPRFLSPAWPYYAGALSTSVGFLLFSAFWLASDSREPRTKGHAKGKVE